MGTTKGEKRAYFVIVEVTVELALVFVRRDMLEEEITRRASINRVQSANWRYKEIMTTIAYLKHLGCQYWPSVPLTSRPRMTSSHPEHVMALAPPFLLAAEAAGFFAASKAAAVATDAEAAGRGDASRFGLAAVDPNVIMGGGGAGPEELWW